MEITHHYLSLSRADPLLMTEVCPEQWLWG